MSKFHIHVSHWLHLLILTLEAKKLVRKLRFKFSCFKRIAVVYSNSNIVHYCTIAGMHKFSLNCAARGNFGSNMTRLLLHSPVHIHYKNIYPKSRLIDVKHNPIVHVQSYANDNLVLWNMRHQICTKWQIEYAQTSSIIN